LQQPAWEFNPFGLVGPGLKPELGKALWNGLSFYYFDFKV